ncbi:MAG: hypothetical protein ABIS86_24180 [Streptosporangiaceae bacterium]
MAAVLLACATMAVYFTGFAIFKLAAPQLDHLTSARPFRTAMLLLLNRRWLAGLVVVLTGLCMESRLLLSAPLALAVPVLVANLIFLLLIAVAGFGERLSAREWAGLGVIVLAVAALAVSATSTELTAPSWPDSPSPWQLTGIIAPPFVVAVWIFCVRERTEDGRHARPLNGIAHGVGAGTLVGIAAVLAMGLARSIQVNGAGDLYASPSLYLIIINGGLGLGLAQIAMQYCRLFVIVTIVMVTSKLFLLVMGSLLYAQPWPDDLAMVALRIIGLVLAAVAIWLFPRHQRRTPAGAPPVEINTETDTDSEINTEINTEISSETATELDPVAAIAASYSGHHRRFRGGSLPASGYRPRSNEELPSSEAVSRS